jgi:hypothetical protein
LADETIEDDGTRRDDPVTPAGVSGASARDLPTVAQDMGEPKVHGVFAHARLTALGAPANDNSIVEAPGARERGFEPAIFALNNGDTLLTWVGPDGHAHGHLCGSAQNDDDDSWISPPKYAILNSELSDLGPVVSPLESDRRIQVTEPRPGTFAIMWLALSEGGLAARGRMLLRPDTDRYPSSGDAPWTLRPIEDVPLPGFARGFRVATGGTDQILVSYETAKTSQYIVVSTSNGRELATHDNGHTTIEPATADSTGQGARDHAAFFSLADPPAHHEPPNPPKAVVAIQMANEAGTNETAPTVTSLGYGFAMGWQTPGSSDGVTQFEVSIFDAHGQAQTLPDGGTVLLISDNVAADTPPAITELGNGFAVAYKHGDDGKLAVKTYDGDYALLGEETVVDEGTAGTIYDLAAASIRVGDRSPQVAVAYTVEDNEPANDVGGYHYGHILLQRLGVIDEGGSPHVVPLGRDGEQDGNDQPAALTIETPEGTAPIVGRSPLLAGLDNGELAVLWVESDGTRETIRGEVLEQDGHQVLRLDLTGLIGYEGIVRGTTPDLIDAGNGDILVSWMQHDGGSGDYVVMAALFDSVSQGVWTEPEKPVRLKSFDERPDNYSVALSHSDGLSILVTWDEDSSGKGSGGITTQRYNMTGETLGGPRAVETRASLPGSDQLPSSFAAAGLTEGQVVVVYAEQGSRGETDLAAHIIDVDELIGAPSGAIAGQGLRKTGDSAPSEATETAHYSTEVDQEIALDLLGNAGVGGNIARVNGEPINVTTPVDVGAAWVQLRDDGWLTVSPNTGYQGPIGFEYSVALPDGAESVSNVTVNVEPADSPVEASAFNQLTSLAEDALPTGSAGGDFGGDTQGFGTEALTAAGLDASMFMIVDSTLYLKGGVEFDFDAGKSLTNEALVAYDPTSLAHTVEAGGQGEAGGGLELTAVQSDDSDDAELSSSGYAAFRRLMNAGALAQVGEDVVITLSLGDAEAPHTITLRGLSLSTLADTDFKF